MSFCTVTTCYAYGGYCRREGHMKANNTEKAVAKPEKPKSAVAPIKHHSKKREKLQREYRALVKDELSKNKECQIKSPDCTGLAQGMQHIVKRSEKNLKEKSNLLRACNACNGWIERNPKEAIKLKVSKSKFAK